MNRQAATCRTFLALVLLCAYAVCPLRVYLPYLDYKINYKYIATVLCVNKEKPKMACNGKCHLKKNLKKAAEENAGEKKQVSQQLQEQMVAEVVLFTVPSRWESTVESFIFYNDKQLPAACGYLSPPPRC